MSRSHRLLLRFAIATVLLALPAFIMVACGSDSEEQTTSAPADVPELGAAQLGAGAGPTPIPVTPTPTPTPSPKHLSLYDPVWEGSFTVHDGTTNEDRTVNIVLEILTPEMIGEGAQRRRDNGAIFTEGTTGWMALSFMVVDSDTGNVQFLVPAIQTRFKGVVEGDKFSGTVEEGVINKGTFEVQANRDKSPQRRPDALAGGSVQ